MRAPVALSVVMPAFNAEATIGAALGAVLAQECTERWEVLVVDDRSTDGTLAVVEALGRGREELVVVGAGGAGSAGGVGAARNRGARRARGRFLLFTDADDVVAPGWLAAMSAALRERELVAARLDHARLNPPWTVAFRGGEQVDRLERFPGGPPWPRAYGTSLGIARRLHEAVGGFDESLAATQDMDYCYRVQRETGVELAFVPDAVVHYRHRATLRGTVRQASSYGYSSMRMQERFADVWPQPIGSLPLPNLALRMARRALMPDSAGGRRLDPVRSRAALGAWCWQLGSELGQRRGRRALDGERS